MKSMVEKKSWQLNVWIRFWKRPEPTGNSFQVAIITVDFGYEGPLDTGGSAALLFMNGRMNWYVAPRPSLMALVRVNSSQTPINVSEQRSLAFLIKSGVLHSSSRRVPTDKNPPFETRLLTFHMYMKCCLYKHNSGVMIGTS
jgi:hypothetical protein